MAFSYQSLKRLTGDAFLSETISNANLADTTVDTGTLANNSVTASKFATNAVDVGSNVVTGTLPIANGGLGTTSFSGANQAITSNGTSLTTSPHGIYGMQIWTSSGTWTRPSNVRYIKVQVQASGGGASGHGESGGSGGYSERILNVTGISSVSISISGEGSGTYYSGAGGNAGGTSFGNYCSASGGYGANRNNQHSGGLGGVGSGGNLNMYGGGGGSHHQRTGIGGSTFWGGSIAGGHPQGGHFSHRHEGHGAPGAGGAGGYFTGHRGSNGLRGMVVVTMYY